MEGTAQPEAENDELTEFEEEEHHELVYVNFSAPVFHSTAESLLNVLGYCTRVGAEEVRLLLSTPGGNVSPGINLYNVLRGMPFRLVTHNTGDVSSIGVPVYLAGEKRLTCPNCTFLTHDVTFEPPPGQAFGARWFHERHEALLSDESRINKIIAEHTSLTLAELEAHAGNEQTIGTDEAVAKGFAHGKEDVDIPEDALVLTVPTR